MEIEIHGFTCVVAVALKRMKNKERQVAEELMGGTSCHDCGKFINIRPEDFMVKKGRFIWELTIGGKTLELCALCFAKREDYG